MSRKSDKILRTAVRDEDIRCHKCNKPGVVRESSDGTVIECPSCGRKLGNITVKT